MAHWPVPRLRGLHPSMTKFDGALRSGCCQLNTSSEGQLAGPPLSLARHPALLSKLRRWLAATPAGGYSYLDLGAIGTGVSLMVTRACRLAARWRAPRT